MEPEVSGGWKTTYEGGHRWGTNWPFLGRPSEGKTVLDKKGS